MKWISFIIEIAACIISFGICTAVIRAQFRPRDELAWWKYLVFGITFTAVTYFEVGSNLIASFIGMGICIFFAWRYFEGRFASKVISVIMINVLTILISIICLYVISAFSGVTMEKLTMYRGLCHEESLHFYRICLYKNYKKTERICTTGIADKRDFFCLFFCCLSVFYYPVKTGYVTANLTDSFCSNNAFVSGNHSSCVVALEPLAKSKSRTA